MISAVLSLVPHTLPTAPLPTAPWALGYDALARPDLLPAYRRSIEVGAVTSYDRSGGNDDGFSGRYSFVRKEGDALVLADLKGPGIITRIHTPTPTDEPIDFYFDGEAKPRLSLRYNDLFSGGVAPFLKPLVGAAGGGSYSYVPIPYHRSCKVVLRAKSTMFYDLNYATYPADAPIRSYEPTESVGVRAARLQAQRVLSSVPEAGLTHLNVPPGTHLTRRPFSGLLASGGSLTLLDARSPGRIASLRIATPDALGGKERDVLLRITWDGDRQPSVLVPAGDFFGYAWGRPSMGSLLVGTHGSVAYCNLPMPFDRAAKVELVSLRKGGAPLPIRGETVVGDAGRRPYEGRFYAVWRRENPTTQGRPFTFLDARGRGHLVGLALQSQGLEAGNTFFFEGDDTATIDGSLAIHGTGSEDFFNGGWYDAPGRWDAAFSLPLSGSLGYRRDLGRTGGYRFMLGDAFAYGKSLLQTIEHGPERNAHPSDYASVAYLYADRRPAGTPPTLSVLRTADPKRIVFSAHWTLPIESFSLSNATLSRGPLPSGQTGARTLSFRAQKPGDFDLCFVALRCDLPAAGRYRVTIDAVKGPEAGRVRLFQRESPRGAALDLFSDRWEVANGLPMGEIEAVEGSNVLTFRLEGKNAASKALGLDLINVVCERIDGAKRKGASR